MGLGGLEPALERITYERKERDGGEPVEYDEVRRKRRRAEEPCFACYVSSDDRRIRHLDEFYYKNLAVTEPDALYDQLAELFESEVRQPIIECNKRSSHPDPVPSWSKASMKDHYEDHVLNPTVDSVRNIRRLKVLLDLLFDQVVTRRAGGAARVCGERLRHLECVLRMLDGRYNAKLNEQMFYDPRTSAV